MPDEIIDQILEAARLAPSGNNRQAWKFVVITEAQRRKELAEAARHQDFVAEAPVVIAAVGLDPNRIMSCEIPADPVDVAIAVEHIVLAATAEGLGSCWIGAFSQNRVREILQIPETYKVIELLVIGYPADKPRPKQRKLLKEIVCYEKFL